MKIRKFLDNYIEFIKKCLFENKLKYFHQAINKLIVMNEDSTPHYIYYLFNGALTKSMIKEEEPWL